MSKCVCGADEPCTGYCPKHIRDLHGWPCPDCSREWAEANPNTAAAISRLASGKSANLAAARKADAALAAQPSPASPDTEGGADRG